MAVENGQEKAKGRKVEADEQQWACKLVGELRTLPRMEEWAGRYY